jgi:hypothetical protein
LKKYGKIVRKKERKKSTGKKKKEREKVPKKKEKSMRKKKSGKKVREKKNGKRKGKSKGKSHVTSGDVTSGHAQWSDPPHDSPQILTELSPYTTHVYKE